MDGDASTAGDRRLAFLAGLPGVLRTVPADGDVIATTAPDAVGITSTVERRYSSMLPGGSATVPVLVLDPPVDAVWLADAWGIERPIGVSGDVHQDRWHLLVAGDERPDPHGRRVAGNRPSAGAWIMRVQLDGRPSGPLPDLACGASPAYDLRAARARVVAITVEPHFR